MSILEHVFADTAGAKSSFVNSTVNRLHNTSWHPVQNRRNFRTEICNSRTMHAHDV